MSEIRHILRFRPAARLLLWLGLGTIFVFGGMLVLTPAGLSGVLLRFATGFHHFLATNLREISVNADILIPGIAAFGIATLALHGMSAACCRKRGKPWPFSNTCCLAALLPVLFIIAHLVPGVILQIQLLAAESGFVAAG
jgi:hypothetical protein